MDFKQLANKWQQLWEKDGVFRAVKDTTKKKFYCLEMYPYPSGKLHMGHVRNYSLGDCFSRFKRMRGFNVLYPMGYDSFGLPAENAAIKNSVHPRSWTDERMKDMQQQQRELGLSYDWSRKVFSHDPEYYRWNQWLFVQLFKKGLAYKKKSLVNWDPVDQTVLANEQVIDGKGWRSGAVVEKREIEQWYLKITAYAEELLADIDTLDHWPDKVKAMQRNWIGKSEGTIINFDVVDASGKKIDTIETFTTRPDTIFGVTYLVLAAEHPKCIAWSAGTEHEKNVADFISKTLTRSVIDRTAEGKEKHGVPLGVSIINPVNGKQCPVWVADYALMDYGTGAVMAVPTHDQRDFEFAQKYNLDKHVVISPLDGWKLDAAKMTRAFVDEGKLINSGEFDGMHNHDAIIAISSWLEKNGWGKRTVTYKLRDWLISRQRYWGTPIPIYYDDAGVAHAVPEQDLPVQLPDDVDFSKGGNPIATSDSFKWYVHEGKKYRRETDTMDTFMDSSWYFLKFTDSTRTAIFNPEEAKYWMPVDQYIGGIEHACLHLIYARFITKVFRDIGLIDIKEPFNNLLTQGMVIKDGAKMSKSLGNVVDPGVIMDAYGPDTARVFILFTALPEKELEWSDAGVEGSYRFLKRVYALKDLQASRTGTLNAYDQYLRSRTHRVVRAVTADMEAFRVSIAIGTMMSFVHEIHEYAPLAHAEVLQEAIKTVILLLCPITPHICEEVWHELGHDAYCSLADWPLYDEQLIDDAVEAGHVMVEQTISDIRAVLGLLGTTTPKRITLFVADAWKYDACACIKKELTHTRDVGAIMKAVLACTPADHKRAIAQLVPRMIKDPSKLPQVVLTQDAELAALETYVKKMQTIFSSEILVQSAESSSEAKAQQALPGKPSILVTQ